MPHHTITISVEAHARLKKLKVGSESFTEVILRELPERANTCGELLDWMEKTPPPAGLNLDLLDRAMKDRKRRSRR